MTPKGYSRLRSTHAEGIFYLGEYAYNLTDLKLKSINSIDSKKRVVDPDLQIPRGGYRFTSTNTHIKITNLS